MSIKFVTIESSLLTKGYFGYVGTSGKDKMPHVTPAIFVYDGSNVFFITSKVAKKLHNIRENKKISFLVDIRDSSNLYSNVAVLIQGKAKVYGIIDALFQIPRLLKIRTLFLKKYPEYMKAYRVKRKMLPKAWRTTLFISRLLVRIDPEKFLYWHEARPIRLQM